MADRDPRERARRRESSWLEDSGAEARGDDYTRELADRYGHGEGGYDRGAYRQGGHGEATRDHGGLDADAPRGVRGKRVADSSDRGAPRARAGRDRGDGARWAGGGHDGANRFGGGADQDMRSGGQYQGESGHGARPAQAGDFAGGGYLGRGTGSRPQHAARSGGAFGDNPRGWYGPDGGHGDGGRGGASAQPATGFRGRGPKNYQRPDQRIVEDLCERLTDDDDIDASDIEVQVDQGVVTLAGTVGERWMKHRAEDLAGRCSGVRDVDNRIRVVRGDTR